MVGGVRQSWPLFSGPALFLALRPSDGPGAGFGIGWQERIRTPTRRESASYDCGVKATAEVNWVGNGTR